MVGEIWGSGVGLAEAGLRQKFREMKRLERDMVAMDQPGFTRTVQETSIYYDVKGNAIGISEGQLQEITDLSVENQLRSIAAQAKRATELEEFVARYEDAFGKMGGSNAFITSGNKVVTTINTLCSHGGDTPANKRAVLEALKDHMRQIKIAADKLQSLRDSASQKLSTKIPEVNQLLSDIASINARMADSAATSDANVSYLRQRRVKLDELAEYMEIKLEEANSEFLVYTPKGRVLVQGSLAAKFIYNPPPQIDATQDFGDGTITLQSVAADPTAAELGAPPLGGDDYYFRREEAFVFDVSSDFADLQGGAMSGLMAFLQGDSILFAQELDAYAAGFRDSFNALHNLSSAIQPRAMLQGSAGYIGGNSVTAPLAINAAGTLRIAVIDTTTNLATLSADIDLGAAGITSVNNTADNTALCYLINNNVTLNGHVVAGIVNGALQIRTGDAGCGISLGSVSGVAAPTISLGGAAYGFSEFFHLNDVITAPADFWRGGTITGLASNLTVNTAMLDNVEYFSVRKLRDDALGVDAQAVSGDPTIGRGLSDLFTRTRTDFRTPSGGTISQTLEAFSSGLVKEVANRATELESEKEAQTEAYKQQEAIFLQEYGMDEQEVAIRAMQISKAQDLYFSFINNYYRMIGKIAEMGG